MSAMRSVFEAGPDSLAARFARFGKEAGKMTGFVLQDHWLTSKRALKELGNLLTGKKSALTDTESTGSISKSSLGFMLAYMATIPAILSSIFLKGKGAMAQHISRFSVGLTILSGIFLNFGMVLVALAGKNLGGTNPAGRHRNGAFRYVGGLLHQSSHPTVCSGFPAAWGWPEYHFLRQQGGRKIGLNNPQLKQTHAYVLI